MRILGIDIGGTGNRAEGGPSRGGGMFRRWFLGSALSALYAVNAGAQERTVRIFSGAAGSAAQGQRIGVLGGDAGASRTQGAPGAAEPLAIPSRYSGLSDLRPNKPIVWEIQLGLQRASLVQIDALVYQLRSQSGGVAASAVMHVGDLSVQVFDEKGRELAVIQRLPNAFVITDPTGHVLIKSDVLKFSNKAPGMTLRAVNSQTETAPASKQKGKQKQPARAPKDNSDVVATISMGFTPAGSLGFESDQGREAGVSGWGTPTTGGNRPNRRDMMYTITVANNRYTGEVPPPAQGENAPTVEGSQITHAQMAKVVAVGAMVAPTLEVLKDAQARRDDKGPRRFEWVPLGYVYAAAGTRWGGAVFDVPVWFPLPAGRDPHEDRTKP